MERDSVKKKNVYSDDDVSNQWNMNKDVLFSMHEFSLRRHNWSVDLPSEITSQYDK